MNKFGSLWSKDEDDFLKNNYPSHGQKFCGEKLNRSKRSIYQRTKKLDLKVLPEVKYHLLRKYKKEDIQIAINNSFCISDVCRYFELMPQAGNFVNFKKIINFFDINTEHFISPGELTRRRLKGKKFNKHEKKLEDILIVNSAYDISKLKKRLYKEGLKKCECELCGQGEEWQGKKMSLILDHKNGINNDNRLENLRIVCPNCNATLDTHCSKNRKIRTKEIKIKEIKINEVKKLFRISRMPEIYDLIDDFKKLKSFVQVGKKYGVSDNAVRKWCKKYNIINEVKNFRNYDSKAHVEVATGSYPEGC